ncbi:MAG: hypothetical protein ACM3JF_00510 [Sphaerimonospora mesophila]
MGSPGVGGTISAASDVSLNNPTQDDLFIRGASYWSNMPATGKVALASNGGVENVSTITSTASTTLNLANGNVFNVTLNVATTTFTFSGATSGKACSFAIYLKQNATGNRAVTWPASAKWAGGTAPTISTAANAVDIVVFESIDGGTNWYGSLVGNAFA